MKKEPTVQGRYPRPDAIRSVWWGALAMLGVCIPLVAVMKSASFPFLVIGGAVVATVIIWRSGQERMETSAKEVEAMREHIRDLEERLANVEVMSVFEERLAAREMRRATSQADIEAEEEVPKEFLAVR